jgi:hypothetical protein
MMDGQQDWVCLGPPVLLRSPQASENGHSGGPDHCGKPVADGTSSAAEACHDSGAVHLDVQPIGIQVSRVGAPRLDLLDLASPGCPAGPLGQLGRVGLPDEGLRLARRTGLPVRSRLGEPSGRDQGESGQEDRQEPDYTHAHAMPLLPDHPR